MMVRTQTDGWVVGRKSDQREFYVIFDQKNANLLEINGSPLPAWLLLADACALV
jgi:hypothetical protein